MQCSNLTFQFSGDLWTAGREIVATLWDAHAWLWHGYEVSVCVCVCVRMLIVCVFVYVWQSNICNLKRCSWL